MIKVGQFSFSNILQYLSFKGRISKATMKRLLGELLVLWVITCVLLFVTFVFIIETSVSSGIPKNVLLIVSMIFVVSLVSIFVRRGHDRNRFGGALYLYLVWYLLFVLNGIFISPNSLLCIWFSEEFCYSTMHLVLNFLMAIPLWVVLVYMLLHIIDCYREGSVSGAERFGEAPIDNAD